MLFKIKTPVIKFIFSYINYEKTLRLIMNNINLQKLLDIEYRHYKKISYKYKVGELNGKGKEYFKYNHKIIFEGEYLKGKRNGKGREYYDNGKLKFEGEYLNGKKWNGKEFNLKNEIICEIKDGNGKGKEYFYNGELIFEGEYLKGERWNGYKRDFYIKKILFENHINDGENKLENEYDLNNIYYNRDYYRRNNEYIYIYKCWKYSNLHIFLVKNFFHI